jgi:hypothetical protein
MYKHWPVKWRNDLCGIELPSIACKIQIKLPEI